MKVWTKHDIESFPKARKFDNNIKVWGEVPVLGLEALDRPIHEDLRQIIVNGVSAGARFGSRSEAAFSVITRLLKLGVSPETIIGLFLNPAHKISERYLERSNPAQQIALEINRANIKISEGWPDVFKNGNPKPSFHNAYVGLIRLGAEVRYDEFRNRLMVGSLPMQSYVGELSDRAVTIIRKVFLDQHGFDTFTPHIRDGLETLAYENSYHPIKVYFETLQWDRKPRIRLFLHQYMGADNSELNQAVSMLMFVAAVRRIKMPGVKFDTMIVLEGPQGSGKSTALRILASDAFFSDQDIISADSKTQMELLESVWIYEICELSGMRHTDVAKIKSFLSRQEDRGRPAYGRYKEVQKRQSIFVGTTNDETYLKDQTGNRRFLPVKTGVIDLAAIQADRDQLWAETLYWEEKGEPIILPEELWDAAAKEQDARLYQDPWEDVLSDLKGKRVGDEERIFTRDVYMKLEIQPNQRQHFLNTRLGACMRKLGWEGPKRIRIKNQSLMGYLRPFTDDGDHHEPF